MKLRSYAFLVATTFVLATPATANAPASDPFPYVHNDPLYDQETYQELRDITVDISWSQTTLADALRDLTLMVRNTHPIHASINFGMSSSATPAERARKVNLLLKGAPVYNVLGYLNQQAPFIIKVHPDVVLIIPLPSGKTQ
jgi:hypothetical protein